MILKSLIIASIIFNYLGFSDLATKFDQAVIKEKFGSTNQVAASSDNLLLPDILPRPQIRPGAFSPAILARNYLLVDLDSSKILLKQNHRRRVPIASTTKIMTAVVVLENYDLDDVVVVSAAANSQPGATANLQIGEEITVHSLLKALLIKSGNDSAYALAEHMNKQRGQSPFGDSPLETEGTVPIRGQSPFADNGEGTVPPRGLSPVSGTAKFVSAMNLKAEELGMVDTEYHDPAGLDTTGYSSAYDLFLVVKHALQNPIFAEIVKTEETVITGTVISGEFGDSPRSGTVPLTIWHQLKTSNRLVGEYKYLGAIGIKTGYMPEAGHVLVSAAKRGSRTFVGVIIDTFADTAPASADESKKLLDWGFENIVWD